MDKRTAWVPDEAGRRAEEARVAALIGATIVGGRYFEIAYPSGTPEWFGEDFHALDYGLELDLEGRAPWSFSWDQAGPDEALDAYEGPFVRGEGDYNFGIWDVGEVQAWQAILGATIVGVTSFWESNRVHLCPITWVLELSVDKDLVLTMGTRTELGEFRGSHDDVAVFFSLETARRHGVALPAGGKRPRLWTRAVATKQNPATFKTRAVRSCRA